MRLLQGLLIARRLGRDGARQSADVTLLNVSYDPTRELYQDFNAAFAEALEGEAGEKVTDQAVARRLRQAGARGDRRPRGRRRDARARLRHRRDRREGEAAARRLAEAPAAQQHAVHVDHRVPGAQGQSEGHQGLGRPGEAGRRRDHAESEDLGRRALELPRRLGLRASSKYGSDDARRRSSSRSSTRTCRCSTPARAARRPPSSSAASATCCSRGRTRRSSRSRNSGADKFEIVVAVAVASSPSRRSRWSTRTSTSKGTRKVAEAYLEYLYTDEGQEIAAKQLLPADRSGGRREVREAVSEDRRCSPIDDAFGGWQKAQKTHFADGGMFDQIYTASDGMHRRASFAASACDARERGGPRSEAERQAARRVLPGFGLRSAITLLYLVR